MKCCRLGGLSWGGLMQQFSDILLVRQPCRLHWLRSSLRRWIVQTELRGVGISVPRSISLALLEFCFVVLPYELRKQE